MASMTNLKNMLSVDKQNQKYQHSYLRSPNIYSDEDRVPDIAAASIRRKHALHLRMSDWQLEDRRSGRDLRWLKEQSRSAHVI